MTAHNIRPFQFSIRPDDDFHLDRFREVHLPCDLRIMWRGLRQSSTGILRRNGQCECTEQRKYENNLQHSSHLSTRAHVSRQPMNQSGTVTPCLMVFPFWIDY